MKFRFNLILVFTLIFILGAFCVSSCKKAAQHDKINDKAARKAEFVDERVKWDDEILDGLAAKIDEDLAKLKNAYAKNTWDDIVEVLGEIRKHDGNKTKDPDQIKYYFQDLKGVHGKPPVEGFDFEFAGAVVLPVNIENPHFADDEINFVCYVRYMFKFNPSGSADPVGNGGGDREHKFDCTWQ